MNLVTMDDNIKFDSEVSSLLEKHNMSVLSISKFLDVIKRTIWSEIDKKVRPVAA